MYYMFSHYQEANKIGNMTMLDLLELYSINFYHEEFQDQVLYANFLEYLLLLL